MKSLALLLLCVAAAYSAGGIYWYDYPAWPLYWGGITPLRQQVDSIPNAIDRAALFWLGVVRVSPVDFANMNNDIVSGSIACTNDADVATARSVGWNSLRMTRAHAWDRMNNCPSAPLNVYVGGNTTSYWVDCVNSSMPNTTSPAGRWTRWLNTDVRKTPADIYDLTIHRNGFTDQTNLRSEIHAGKMAIADLVCRSESGYNPVTHKFDSCSCDERADIRWLAAAEMACGGVVTLTSGGWIQSYAANCVLLNTVETNLRTEKPDWYVGVNNDIIQVATHTVSASNTLMYGLIGIFIPSQYNIFLQTAQGETINTYTGAQLTALGLNNVVWYDTGINVNTLSTQACIAYRWQMNRVVGGTGIYYYPGGLSRQGWLKTYGLGTCRINYCRCLSIETASAESSADRIYNGCCEDDCYIRVNGYPCHNETDLSCKISTTCNGVVATCPNPPNKTSGTSCDTRSSGTFCYPLNTCDGGGICVDHRPERIGQGCGLNATECRTAWLCAADGSGSCTPGVSEPNYKPCGNTTNYTCHDADYCWNGVCQQNWWPVNTICGAATDCSGFQCNATHHCQQGFFSSTTPCSTWGAKYAVNGTQYECWNQFTCSGFSDVCVQHWRNTNWVCNPRDPTNVCDADDTCQGASETCMPQFAANKSVTPIPCAFGDRYGCRPTMYCEKDTIQCPYQPECTNCRLFTNSIACLNVSAWSNASAEFFGCNWCGVDFGGCWPKDNASDDFCDFHHTCSDKITLDPENVQSYSVSYTCTQTQEAATMIEIVEHVNDTHVQALRSFCFVIDVTSLNPTSYLVGGNQTILFYPVFYPAIEDTPDHFYPATTPRYIWSTPYAFRLDSVGPNPDRGMYEVVINIPAYPTQPVWPISPEDMFLGIRSPVSCPAWDVVGLMDDIDFHDPYAIEFTIWKRANAAAAWVDVLTIPAEDEIEFILSPFVDNGTCNDMVVEWGEDCDPVNSAVFCMAGCRCPAEIDAIADPVNNGCKCRYDLPQPDGHNFTTPPFIVNDTLIYNSNNYTIQFYVRLPETLSYDRTNRFNVSSHLVNSRDGTPTLMSATGTDSLNTSTIPMTKLPCYWQGFKQWRIDNLIAYGNPLSYLLNDEDYWYVLQFAIEVNWCENVQMYEKRADPPASINQTRCMWARLTFELHVRRHFHTSSNITVINSGVLWAYIQHGFINIPQEGDAFFTLEIETSPVEQGLCITPTSFHWITHAGHITNISAITQIGANAPICSQFQTWLYRIYFNIRDICFLDESDVYTLGFQLQSTITGQVSPTWKNISFKLTDSENWCAQHADIDLVGRQRTYALASDCITNNPPSTRFLRGSTIFVVVDIPNWHNLQLTLMRATDVTLWGPALVGWLNHSYDLDVFDGVVNMTETTGIYTYMWSRPGWNVTIFYTPCEVLSGPNKLIQACYTLTLYTEMLHESTRDNTRVLYIDTTVVLWFASIRRDLNVQTQTSTATSRLMVGDEETAAEGTFAQQPVVVYRVTPAFVAAMGALAGISVLSIVSTVWFVRRRDASRL